MNTLQTSLNQQLRTTPATEIAELEIVRDNFIEQYNTCQPEKLGELVYQRNAFHYKQALTENPLLAACDTVSLYNCFMQLAANGFSLDPGDNEVYLIARLGRACLDRQAGAYVKRLLQSNQARSFEQARLVYEQDVFEVDNGRVRKHTESLDSDVIVGGYVRVIVDDIGNDRFFIYRRSDFESWRRRSGNPKTVELMGNNGPYVSESLWDNGVLNGTQPEPNFLRTKIIRHAASEKCWATGTAPAGFRPVNSVEIASSLVPRSSQ